ncbi:MULTISPECIES: helix-turn-helix transcriptional regulator [unclassified Kitasatospora]|uniref:helix-turn-helix domain-containing protein n=1 Tax=unclassified Kitasatospora TaxID=2633591 RepID=UPI0033D3792C
MTSEPNEFAALLRTWRDRVQPADLGLPPGPARRVPGLRREELATFANLSVDYIVRMEQGRADPSAATVAALGRALRLSREELAHFYRLADHLPPSDLVVPTHISPGVQRLLTRLADTPVAVYDAAWTLITGNPMWTSVFGHTAAGRPGNVAWTVFTRPLDDVLLESEEIDRFQQALVADLRITHGRYPHDRFVGQLVSDLLDTSPRFATLWAKGAVIPFASERKTLHHPTVGRLDLDCDVLTAVDNDLRIVAYTAPPTSETAGKLQLLSVVGTMDTVPAH